MPDLADYVAAKLSIISERAVTVANGLK